MTGDGGEYSGKNSLSHQALATGTVTASLHQTQLCTYLGGSVFLPVAKIVRSRRTNSQAFGPEFTGSPLAVCSMARPCRTEDTGKEESRVHEKKGKKVVVWQNRLHQMRLNQDRLHQNRLHQNRLH